VEIVVHGEERIGFEFPKHAAQFLFDPVDGVEEIPAVHVKLRAAQFPVRSEQEVIVENAILRFRQSSFADQTKVCCKLFVLATPGAPAVLAR
jgi:hypothetical protein